MGGTSNVPDVGGPWGILSGAIARKAEEHHQQALQDKEAKRKNQVDALQARIQLEMDKAKQPGGVPDMSVIQQAYDDIGKLYNSKESKTVIQAAANAVGKVLHHHRLASASQPQAGQQPNTSAAPPGLSLPKFTPVDPSIATKQTADLYKQETQAQADIEGQAPKRMYDSLRSIPGMTDDDARKIVTEKFGGAAARPKLITKLEPDENMPTKWAWVTRDAASGNEYSRNAGARPGTETDSTSTSLQHYDPATGTTTTSRSTRKSASGQSQPASSRPSAKSSSSSTAAVPGWMKSPRIKAMAEAWKRGEVPPAKDKPYVEQYMAEHDMQPGFKPTGQSRSRADAAKAVVPLVQSLKQQLQDKDLRAQLGVLPGRTSEIEKRIGNLDPKVQKFYGTLKSIYALAGAMHGWRTMKVADEFEKAYGGLHTRPESIESAMDAMIETAGDVYQAGYNEPMEGLGGSTDPAVPPGMSKPGAGASGGAPDVDKVLDDIFGKAK